MWAIVYKNLENREFVLHSHSTTLTVIRLVVPGTLVGTSVVSTARSLPSRSRRPDRVPDSAFDHGCCRAGVGWRGYAISVGMDCVPVGLEEVRPPPLGQQFSQTSGLQAGARCGSAPSLILFGFDFFKSHYSIPTHTHIPIIQRFLQCLNCS